MSRACCEEASTQGKDLCKYKRWRILTEGKSYLGRTSLSSSMRFLLTVHSLPSMGIFDLRVNMAHLPQIHHPFNSILSPSSGQSTVLRCSKVRFMLAKRKVMNISTWSPLGLKATRTLRLFRAYAFQVIDDEKKQLLDPPNHGRDSKTGPKIADVDAFPWYRQFLL